MTPIKHPAQYSDCLIPVLASLLQGTQCVLDPMAGTGKLAVIKEYGYRGVVVCNDLEREWVNGYAVDEWRYSDAAAMDWAADEMFDAICTSPVYGNRMGDRTLAWERRSRRMTYDRALGRAPSPGSTLYLQWNKRSGDAYREKHLAIFRECARVLARGGRMLVNISDHIREGQIAAVVDWYRAALVSLGLTLIDDLAVETPRHRFGANRDARVSAEHILVLAR